MRLVISTLKGDVQAAASAGYSGNLCWLDYMISTRLEFVRPSELWEHEEVDPDRLQKTFRIIKEQGVLKRSLAVDSRTLVVLDGVHRLNVLRQLRCMRVPVCLFDYMSEEIVVGVADRKKIISKEDVIDAALSGRKFPPRTTWHMVRTDDGSLKHISCIEKEIRSPLITLSAEGAIQPERDGICTI